MKKFKGSMIFIISLLMAFQNNINSFVVAKDNKAKPNNQETLQTIDMALLTKNPDWKKLSAFWKKMNELFINKDYRANLNQFKELRKQNELLSPSIDNLVKAKLINEKEKDRLKRTFEERVSFLEFKAGLVLCYSMSPIGGEIVIRREDLENRYNIFEKLYKENKINSETFKQSKAKIMEDLKFIDDNSNLKPEMLRQIELIDLLVNLNK